MTIIIITIKPITITIIAIITITIKQITMMIMIRMIRMINGNNGNNNIIIKHTHQWQKVQKCGKRVRPLGQLERPIIEWLPLIFYFLQMLLFPNFLCALPLYHNNH